MSFFTFCFHLPPFLVCASRRWCRKQPALQTVAAVHWHHTAGVVPAIPKNFGQIARYTSLALALQCPDAPRTLEITCPHVPSIACIFSTCNASVPDHKPGLALTALIIFTVRCQNSVILFEEQEGGKSSHPVDAAIR